MSNLAQIERVLFLQDVELFSYCEAAQIMRIAAIANEREYQAKESVYSIMDPSSAIHCVVRGQVGLASPTQQRGEVPPGSAFGLIDVLSGRQRRLNEVAEVDTLTLTIEADDFFDLLSNNIGIIRSLVRMLAERVSTPVVW